MKLEIKSAHGCFVDGQLILDGKDLSRNVLEAELFIREGRSKLMLLLSVDEMDIDMPVDDLEVNHE